MTERENQISENYKRVVENIREAELRRGEGEHVTLLAATKTVPAEEIVFASEKLGLAVAGENRVQEFNEKYDAVSPKLDYQFIGHLQTNKAKHVVGRASLIHSVSSLKLARELDRLAGARDVVQDVLIEINCAAEESKSGFLIADTPFVIDEFEAFSSLRLLGIMTMGPAGAEKSLLRKYFREIYAIFIDNFPKKSHNIRETILSMGMSGSYELAIEEGATMVRVGSAIFGQRNYP